MSSLSGFAEPMQTEQPLSDYERERGKPMPSKLHSIVQKHLIIALHAFEPPYTVFSELTLQLNDRELTPDLSIYEDMTVDFAEDEVRVTDPPLLTVEIASPTQSVQDLVDKIRFQLDHGVRSCWLVQPPLRTVTVFAEGLDSTTYDRGTVTDPTVAIEVDIDEIFSAP